MYHTIQSRKVLRLENKKKPDTSSSHRKSFRKQCKTFSGYGQKRESLSLYKPRSMTISARSSLHSHDRNNIRNLSIECRGYKNCGDSFYLSNFLGENMRSYFPYHQMVEDGTTSDLDISGIPCKINVMGAPNVGKTSLIQMFTSKPSGCISKLQTDEDDLCDEKLLLRVDDTVVNLEFHETDMRMQRDIPNRDSDAFFLVYSLGDRRTLSTAATILRQMRNKYKVTSPIFLVANKMDLVGKVSISKDDGRLLEKEFKCKYMETSLLHQNDYHKLLLDIIKKILVKDEFYNDEESISFELDSLPVEASAVGLFVLNGCYHPDSVLILGHSFIVRLQRFMNRSEHLQANLGLNLREKAYYGGYSGCTIDRISLRGL
ncbi:uncharacterized protein LOC134274792 [Saccostrea cucullata]|uniref:uncharacterized protein LOC134274792 n=1 Tax=Saccostrea cuccullata TaxID=36930 RepID=UPI002ED27F1C